MKYLCLIKLFFLIPPWLERLSKILILIFEDPPKNCKRQKDGKIWQKPVQTEKDCKKDGKRQ